MNEKWILRISIVGLVIFSLYLWQSRPMNIETTKIYYAVIKDGKVEIEKTEPIMSMGCNTYWRIKGYPCYEITK